MSASTRDTCEHLKCNKPITMYCEDDDVVLCDKCAVTFYSQCKIYNIIRPDKSNFALQSISTIINQALLYSSTNWLKKNKKGFKNELNNFKK